MAIRISLLLEASVRRHLQLADVDGISVLPTTKIFDQLSLIGCAAHVVNLIVQDGIKHVGSSIESIRCGIKWIKKSGARIEKFNKLQGVSRCESTKSLILDCPTRWNSTYNMLVVAHEYKDAFTRNKYEFLDVIVDDHYGREGISVVEKKKEYIKGKMKLLYEEYVRIHAPSSTSSSTLGKRPRSTNTSHELDHGDMLRRRMKTAPSSSSSTSELEIIIVNVVNL
ncbi:zinc finger BED domain-containing protein RICESLEEPER 2-like protein [Tanacetum coccineum]